MHLNEQYSIVEKTHLPDGDTVKTLVNYIPVNDRKYVFHFRPKPKLEKHLALGRIPKPKPKVLSNLISKFFLYNFGIFFKLIFEIMFVFKFKRKFTFTISKLVY